MVVVPPTLWLLVSTGIMCWTEITMRDSFPIEIGVCDETDSAPDILIAYAKYSSLPNDIQDYLTEFDDNLKELLGTSSLQCLREELSLQFCPGSITSVALEQCQQKYTTLRDALSGLNVFDVQYIHNAQTLRQLSELFEKRSVRSIHAPGRVFRYLNSQIVMDTCAVEEGDIQAINQSLLCWKEKTQSTENIMNSCYNMSISGTDPNYIIFLIGCGYVAMVSLLHLYREHIIVRLVMNW